MKVTEVERKHATAQSISEEEASGMKAKSKESVEKSAEVYAKSVTPWGSHK